MKRIVLLVIVALMVLAAPASAAGVKIGVVNLPMVMTESDAGKKANSELGALVQARQAAVDEQQRVVDGLKKALEAESASLTADAKQARQAELDRATAELQKRVSDANAEIDKKTQDLKSQLLKGIGAALRSVAQKNEYTLVVDATAVYYFAPATDITWEVVREFNDAVQK